jgi:hypothetical protein
MVSRFFDPFLIQKAKQQDFWDIYQRATERKDRQAQVISQILSDMTRNVQRMITAKIREENQKRNYQRRLLQAKGNVLGMIVARPDYFSDPKVSNAMPELQVLFERDEKGNLKNINLDKFVKQVDIQPERWFDLEGYLNNIYRIKSAIESREFRKELALQLRALSANTLRGVTTDLVRYVSNLDALSKEVPESKFIKDVVNTIYSKIEKGEKNLEGWIGNVLANIDPIRIPADEAKTTAQNWVKLAQTKGVPKEKVKEEIENFFKNLSLDQLNNFYNNILRIRLDLPTYGANIRITSDAVHQARLVMNKVLENRLAQAGIFSFLSVQNTIQTEKPTEKPIVSSEKLDTETEIKDDTVRIKVRLQQ